MANDLSTLCRGIEFRTRIDPYQGRKLYQCTTCNRVARTERRHQEPNRNTASHDKTMGSLWDASKAD